MKDISLPDGTPNKKSNLLAGYNKGYLVAAAAVVILAAVLFIAGLTAKQTLLTGVLLSSRQDAPASASQSLEAGFLESIDLDPSVAKLRLFTALQYSPELTEDSLTANLTAIETLTRYISDGAIDFVIGEAAALETLAYSDFFVDLRDILTPEQLAALGSRILYMDLAVIRQLEEMADSKVYPEDFSLPDSSRPELMTEPVPVFVDVRDCGSLEPFFPGTSCLLGAAQNSDRAKTLSAFVDYLTGQ